MGDQWFESQSRRWIEEGTINNIVVFGVTGAGKSQIANLLLGEGLGGDSGEKVVKKEVQIKRKGGVRVIEVPDLQINDENLIKESVLKIR